MMFKVETALAYDFEGTRLWVLVKVTFYGIVEGDQHPLTHR